MTYRSLSLLLFFVVACTSSNAPPDPCMATHQCFAQDEFGCCSGARSTVSVCDACPAGTVVEASCRTAGCEACEDICRPALDEAGCCGAARRAVGNVAAGCTCPEGTVPDEECSDVFPACGCPPEFDPLPAPPPRDALPPVPPADAGPRTDAGAGHSDAAPAFDAAPPPPMCVVDLGGGCCGDGTVPVEACGCRTGTIPESECMDFARFGSPQCFEDLGSGCCGDEVPTCGVECPTGTLEAADCFPVETGFCSAVDEAGCCGDAVELNSCGGCPPASIPTVDCDPAACG